MTQITKRTFDEVVAPYSSEIRDLTLAARAMLIAAMPGVEESGDARGPYISYGYGPGYKGIVCYLTISKSGVKMGMARGANLPDPRGLLEGDGKSNRYIPLRTIADLKQPGIKALIKASLAAWKRDIAAPEAKKK